MSSDNPGTAAGRFHVIVAATRSNDPEVHKDGCADVRRGLKSGKYQHATRIEVSAAEDAAAWFWADFLPGGCAYEESYYHEDAPEGQRGMQDADAQGYTTYMPCTKGLPSRGAGQEPEQTAVLFRVWKAKKDGGDVIAIFPFERNHRNGMVMMYEHMGQHGEGDQGGVMARTRPATPAEYAALKRELESPPFTYVLDVRQRTPGRGAAYRNRNGARS